MEIFNSRSLLETIYHWYGNDVVEAYLDEQMSIQLILNNFLMKHIENETSG